MEISYDRNANAIYISFNSLPDGEREEIEEIVRLKDHSVALDFAADGRLLGFEVWNARSGINLMELEFIQLRFKGI